MKLHEINRADEPIVVELANRWIKAGKAVTLIWNEHGKTHHASVRLIRSAMSGDGYAILYDQAHADSTITSDKIFFSGADLENAQLEQDEDEDWTLDMRQNP